MLRQRLRHWLPQLNLNVRSEVVRCAACGSSGGLLDHLRRRGNGIQLHARWCCSPECFEHATRREFNQLLSRQQTPGLEHRHRMPLGLLLLSHGVIDRLQLESALTAQRRAGHGRIGEWLQKLGYATEREITRALSVQWGCPMLRSTGLQPSPEYFIPSPLSTLYGVIPVHYAAATRKLYMAFSSRIDRSLLYATGQMLECDTEACVIGESLINRELESMRRSVEAEIVFDSAQSSTEMARICCSYALQLRANHMRLARCGHYLWTRFRRPTGAFDLLFRSSIEAAHT
jgi:hypothetical protein